LAGGPSLGGRDGAFGANLEAGHGERPERADQGDVDRLSAVTDDDTLDAGLVVSRVEGVPAAVEAGLEPGREVDRLGRRGAASGAAASRSTRGRSVARFLTCSLCRAA
jgi:hypothetical protein